MEKDLDLILTPASDENVPADLERKQENLRHLLRDDPLPRSEPLKGGSTEFRDTGIEIHAAAGEIHLPGLQALLSEAQHVAPQVVTVLLAFFSGHYGRKVKVKVGDVEIEASTAKEVLELMKQARAIKEINTPSPPDDTNA